MSHENWFNLFPVNLQTRVASVILGNLCFIILQLLVEVPYLFAQSVIYVIVTYPMIGYSLSAYKIFWSLYGMFCTLLCFNYLGMLLISVTPNAQVAIILCSIAFTTMNFFAGFIVPKKVTSTLKLDSYFLHCFPR
jgi:ABC-type multidrug transport system permease subunit